MRFIAIATLSLFASIASAKVQPTTLDALWDTASLVVRGQVRNIHDNEGGRYATIAVERVFKAEALAGELETVEVWAMDKGDDELSGDLQTGQRVFLFLAAPGLEHREARDILHAGNGMFLITGDRRYIELHSMVAMPEGIPTPRYMKGSAAALETWMERHKKRAAPVDLPSND